MPYTSVFLLVVTDMQSFRNEYVADITALTVEL